MPPLPDRFDLWVRRARVCPDPERGLDYVLGALITLPDWYLLNLGAAENPQPATGKINDHPYLLVFSDSDRVLETARDMSIACRDSAPPIIAIPTAKALAWCIEKRPMEAEGLLINPGKDNALIAFEHVAAFAEGWRRRGGVQAAGFWIPNLTSEEEDFWQEHGL